MVVLGRECLRALRAHVTAKRPCPVLNEAGVVLGKQTFAAAEPTGYKSKRGAIGEYTLDAVVLLVEHRAKKQSEYVSACTARGTKAVIVTDKADVLAFLDGEAETSTQLVQMDAGGGAAPEAAVPQVSAAAAAGGAAPREDEGRADDEACYDGESYVNCRSTGILAPAKDFKFATELYDRHRQRARAALEDKKRPPSSSAESNADPAKRRREGEAKRDVEPTRIIVVPNAASAALTLLNAGDFVEHGRFLTNAEKKLAGAKKEVSYTFEKTRADGSKASYRIVDNPARLKDDEWARVVAVFAQGPLWQFKGWKYAKPVEIFQKAIGFHIHFDDEKTDDNISQWNVHVRHLGAARLVGPLEPCNRC